MPLTRRALLALPAVLSGCAGSPPSATWNDAHGSPSAEPSLSASEIPSASPSASRAPSAVKLAMDKGLGIKPHPWYAGAVVLAMVNGKVTVHETVGDALRFKAGPVELPVGQRIAMRPDTIFDQASVTKVYTAVLVLQLVDEGKVALDAPVKSYLDEFPHGTVTVQMLLAHTSGLPVGAPSRTWPAVMTCPLVSGATPGTVFRYSSVGLMVLGKLVEKLTGQALDQAVKSRITGPLGLKDTGFHPLKWAPKERIAATDARSGRGLLHGVVHDDVCNSLGGVAGHAGLFSSAMDLAVFGQALLNGGQYQGTRLLSASIVDKMVTNVNPGLPSIDAERPYRTSEHGLGVVLNQPWLMGKLSAPDTFGHTGFAGTSLVVSRKRKTVLVVLTNRAHPNWSWANPDPIRLEVANLMP